MGAKLWNGDSNLQIISESDLCYSLDLSAFITIVQKSDDAMGSVLPNFRSYKTLSEIPAWYDPVLLKKSESFVETMYKAAVSSDLVDMWSGRGMKLTDNNLTHLKKWQLQSRWVDNHVD